MKRCAARRKIVAVGVVATATVVACGFGGPKNNGGDDVIDPDGGVIVPDAGECTGISSMCLPNGDVRKCLDGVGSAIDLPCTWGCVPTGEAHCGAIVPSGGGVAPGDLDSTGLGDVVLTGVIDGNTGAISGATTRGPGTGVKAGIDYKVSASGVAIFRANSIHITGALALGGKLPIAFVANGAIQIDALVDARGAPACGYSADQKHGLQQPGPGGFAGGDPKAPALGSGGGAGSTTSGGGGGHAGSGGTGGTSAGGLAFGDAAITALIGGGGGGGGDGGGDAGRGGGGGGAVQFVSNASIIINAAGGINAGGCGGDSGDGGGDFGGGGGAGGAILLEAPRIDIAGALAVNGGGGGANGNSLAARGVDATLDRAQAAGGASNTGNGGAGGAGATSDGVDGQMVTKVGGGGGGIGWLRFDTRDGKVKKTGAPILSPDLADNPGAPHCTVGKPTLQ